MKKHALLSTLFFSFITANNANANYQVAPGSIVWKEQTYWASSAYKEISGYADYYVGYRTNTPHYSQPTNNTCGATVLSMIDSFERLKGSGRMPPQPDIIGIYDLINTDNTSGLNTNELKAGIVALGLFGGNFLELGSDTIDEAIVDNFYIRSPKIIYGNSYFGSAGGHYYAATGGIYCDDTLTDHDQCIFRGLYLNDSILNSPAYPLPDPPDLTGLTWIQKIIKIITYNAEKAQSAGGRALSPNQFYTSAELNTYWKKTGSSLPWEKRHYYIRQQ
ncbi:MAG: hypothetical protein AB2652_20880 [Candidatus Thiodiazotropha endolucinida]